MFRNGFRYTDSRELKVNLHSFKTKQNLRNTTIFQLYTIKDHLWSLIPCSIQLTPPPLTHRKSKGSHYRSGFLEQRTGFSDCYKRLMQPLK